MGEFVWKGTTARGERESGAMVAGSRSAVVQALRRQNIQVVSVRERGREISVPLVAARVSKREVALFTRQLSVMIDAGLPLVQALDLLARDQSNATFARVLARVRGDVESGQGFAEALARHPRIFGDLYVNMVAAGETGGILDVILRRLAAYIEKAIKLARAVRSALVYPSTVVAIAVLVVWVILWKVIPTFEQLFASLDAPLPLPTRATLAASRFIGRYGPWAIPALFLLGSAGRSWYRTRSGRRKVDGLVLRLPVVGILVRKVAVARFCRTLGTLVSSGVPILDGMEITARTAGNAIVEDAILACRRCVEEGKTLAEPLRESGVFPAMVTQMIAVGEQTGALDQMLDRIATFYEEEVDAAVENLMALLEPLMILFLGVTIGGIVISMYLPLFTIVGTMS